jgi:anti-sigma B factor antagonist
VDLVVDDEQRDGVTVLHLHGEVDLTTAPQLRSVVIAAIGAGHHRIVFDLDDVGMLDSTGLGVLIGAVRRARSAGGEVRFVSTRPPLVRLFEVTGLDVAHPLLASVDEALALLPPGR